VIGVPFSARPNVPRNLPAGSRSEVSTKRSSLDATSVAGCSKAATVLPLASSTAPKNVTF
jgi:hypothetical protein